MRHKINNLLIVTGTGRKSGKTTMVCRIIRQFKDKGIVSVKISPHFHEPSPGLIPVIIKDEYKLYEEIDGISSKDTSRMVNAGAGKVFYCQVSDNRIAEAFAEILKQIPTGMAIVCESPALIRFFESGIFVIMESEGLNSREISSIKVFPHLIFTLDQLNRSDRLPFTFVDGEWKLLNEEA